MQSSAGGAAGNESSGTDHHEAGSSVSPGKKQAPRSARDTDILSAQRLFSLRPWDQDQDQRGPTSDVEDLTMWQHPKYVSCVVGTNDSSSQWWHLTRYLWTRWHNPCCRWCLLGTTDDNSVWHQLLRGRSHMLEIIFDALSESVRSDLASLHLLRNAMRIKTRAFKSARCEMVLICSFHSALCYCLTTHCVVVSSLSHCLGPANCTRRSLSHRLTIQPHNGNVSLLTVCCTHRWL